jgi:hypothetical protein
VDTNWMVLLPVGLSPVVFLVQSLVLSQHHEP